MERELTFATLSLAACGSALLLSSGMLTQAGGDCRGDRAEERASARRLWRPVIVAMMVFGVLLGWGLQEPDITNEALSPVVGGVAVLVAAIWSRAVVRAVLSMLAGSGRRLSAARTVGLLRPRVVIEPSLASILDEKELEAVVAHEQAHVRNLDPLRFWMAQIITDLQWPIPGAKARLVTWHHAVELSRDDEARASGVSGEDLASAIVRAAQFAVEGGIATASLVDEPLLARRVARLLMAAERPSRGTAMLAPMPILLATCLVAAVMAGHVFGEKLVRVVAGVD